MIVMLVLLKAIHLKCSGRLNQEIIRNFLNLIELSGLKICDAKVKILKGQIVLIDELIKKLSSYHGTLREKNIRVNA